jgi:polysaccharide export outer membrane protein
MMTLALALAPTAAWSQQTGVQPERPIVAAPEAEWPSADTAVQPEAPAATASGDESAVASTVDPRAYVLGAGDRMRVTVFGEPDLSGEFAVDSTGSVALPLVGQTVAAGLTVDAFEELVERRLRDRRILNTPSVTAEVLNFRPFYILGEVANPGTYPYTAGLDIFGAVATAGGFTPLANQLRVLIKRAGAEEQSYVTHEPLLVQPGDTIRIVKGSIYILGEVNRPGEYSFSPGMTVLSAVATAGGFSYRANKNRVHIRREGESDEKKFVVIPLLPIQPGDTIRVPERFF